MGSTPPPYVFESGWALISAKSFLRPASQFSLVCSPPTSGEEREHSSGGSSNSRRLILMCSAEHVALRRPSNLRGGSEVDIILRGRWTCSQFPRDIVGTLRPRRVLRACSVSHHYQFIPLRSRPCGNVTRATDAPVSASPRPSSLSHCAFKASAVHGRRSPGPREPSSPPKYRCRSHIPIGRISQGAPRGLSCYLVCLLGAVFF